MKACGRTSPVAWGKRCVTGAVPPPRRLRGWCMPTLGLVAPGCLPAAILCAGIRSGGGRGISCRVAHEKPLEGYSPLQHRPGPPHTMPTRSRGIGRGLPLKHRPHSSAARRRHHHGPKPMPRSVLFGRSYRLMHTEELRAGLVQGPRPMNAPCVHDLVRFVKPTVRHRN